MYDICRLNPWKANLLPWHWLQQFSHLLSDCAGWIPEPGILISCWKDLLNNCNWYGLHPWALHHFGPLNMHYWSFQDMPFTIINFFSWATGDPVLANNTSSPCLNWSFLCELLSFLQPPHQSHGLRFNNLSACREHAVTNLRSVIQIFPNPPWLFPAFLL